MSVGVGTDATSAVPTMSLPQMGVQQREVSIFGMQRPEKVFSLYRQGTRVCKLSRGIRTGTGLRMQCLMDLGVVAEA